MAKLLKDRIKALKQGETLSYLAGINRAIDPAQVTKLAKSVDLMGLIRPIVASRISFINGLPTLYIIDGQHLFNAKLRNNIPIEYVEINVTDLKDLVENIALLNASSKSWKLTDYILAWSAVNKDYVKLNSYFNIYDFELSTLAAILSASSIKSNGGNISITKAIKSGEFKIVDETKQVNLLDHLTDVLRIIPRMARFENRYVCAEYISFRNAVGAAYRHKEFMVNLERNKSKFILATQQQQKLSDIFTKLSK